MMMMDVQQQHAWLGHDDDIRSWPDTLEPLDLGPSAFDAMARDFLDAMERVLYDVSARLDAVYPDDLPVILETARDVCTVLDMRVFEYAHEVIVATAIHLHLHLCTRVFTLNEFSSRACDGVTRVNLEPGRVAAAAGCTTLQLLACADAVSHSLVPFRGVTFTL